MRILVCASEAPLPPTNGMRLQLIELTAQLAVRHEVCVLAFRWPEQTGSAPPGVELLTVDPPPPGMLGRLVGWLRAATLRRPLQAVKLNNRMSQSVRRLLQEREFDVAHVTLGALAGIAPALGELPAVIAPLDAWHLNEQARAANAKGLRGALLRAHAREVRRFTSSAYRPYRRVVFVTEQDARAAAALDPTLETRVIPNGVDAGQFHPGSAEPVPGQIVFTGAMHTPANGQAAKLLAREVLPRVRSSRPDARLAIVGRDPCPSVQQLDALDWTEVTGEVSDLRPWLWRAQVFACPMQLGTGIKNKLLEALACGLPCVASSLACQGLGVTHGRELLIADGVEEFACALVELLGDPRRRDALAAAARRYALDHHGWEAVGRAYDDLYREASRSRQVRR